MRRRLAALGVALAIVALASGVVLAASKTIPNDGVFYACYNSGGAVKFIDHSATQTCPEGWTGPVNWYESGRIGIHNVYGIDKTFDEDPDPNYSVLRVWMETGSSSEACLAMLGEAGNGPPAVDQLFCSARKVTFTDESPQWGVYLTLVLAGELEDPGFYSLNVYQEGAKFYGEPKFCPTVNLGCNG